MRHVDRVLAVGQAFGFLEPPPIHQARLALRDAARHAALCGKSLGKALRALIGN